MLKEESHLLREPSCPDGKTGFAFSTSASAVGEEVQALSLVAVQHLLDAVKTIFKAQLDDLRATLPAEVAESVWIRGSLNQVQLPTQASYKESELEKSKPEDVLPIRQRTVSFEDEPEMVQFPSSIKLHVPELSMKRVKSNQSNVSAIVRREWLSGARGVLGTSSTTSQYDNFMPSTLPNVFVDNVGTIGGLKSQIADQLLRHHALLPEQGISSRSQKVSDEAASSASICSARSRSQRTSPTSSDLTGALSILPRAAVIGSRRHPGCQPAGADSSSLTDNLKDPIQLSESDHMFSRGEACDPTRAMTPSIKSLVSTLDQRAVANVEELRLRRVSELTGQLTNGSGGTSSFSLDDLDSPAHDHTSSRALQYDATLELPGQWLLLVFGVLPLRHFLSSLHRHRCCGALAGFYQPSICLVVALACFELIVSSLKLEVNQSWHSIETLAAQLGLHCDLALAVASLVGLLVLGAPLGSGALCECFSLLFLTGDKASHSRLTKRMLRELVGLLLIWLAAVLWRLCVSLLLSDDGPDSGRALHFLSFVVVSGVLISLALTMLSVCHSLAIMIDTYCIKVSDILTSNGDLTVAVREWNVVQAVLRKASKTIEACFFALQTGALAAVILVFLDVRSGSVIQSIPGALVFLGLTRIFYCAAAITDKCADVPSLINSLHFGKDLDVHRQYVVQYIMQSAAGFYVFGVPLNSAVTLKVAYFCVVATLGLMHRVLSIGW